MFPVLHLGDLLLGFSLLQNFKCTTSEYHRCKASLLAFIILPLFSFKFVLQLFQIHIDMNKLPVGHSLYTCLAADTFRMVRMFCDTTSISGGLLLHLAAAGIHYIYPHPPFIFRKILVKGVYKLKLWTYIHLQNGSVKHI